MSAHVGKFVLKVRAKDSDESLAVIEALKSEGDRFDFELIEADVDSVEIESYLHYNPRSVVDAESGESLGGNGVLQWATGEIDAALLRVQDKRRK